MQPLNFLQAYSEYYRDVLAPTQAEIKALTKPWRKPEFWVDRPQFWVERSPGGDLVAPSPIERIYSRIKRPESVVDKIKRHPGYFKGGLTRRNMRRMPDVIGMRIVVRFLGDLLTVDKLLRDDCGFVISEDDPPKAYLPEDLLARLGLSHFERSHKESGYASLHYSLQLKDSQVAQEARPWCELQLRTMAEEAWGQIEHQLGYKPRKGTAMAVRQQFRIIANHLGAVDEHFDFLREELGFLQSVADAEADDKLTAENLPAVLREQSLTCAQQEIDGLLKLLFSRGIERVSEFRATANPGRMQVVRNEYLAKLDRPPTVFDMVANLANMKDCRNREQELRQIDAQIQFLQTWLDLTGRGPESDASEE